LTWPHNPLSVSLIQTSFFWILLVRQILRYYDVNPVSRPETIPAVQWVTGISNIELSNQEQEQIKDIFELFDTDGGGSIAASEMDAAMLALGFKPSKHIQKSSSYQNLDSALDMEKIDRDKSKTITLDEFTAMMKGEVMGLGPLEAIWTAFSALSCSDDLSNGLAVLSETRSSGNDGWGTVSIEGLRRACRHFDVKLTEDELQYMMIETDLDGDGSVDREEFMRIMKKAPWF
jgi:Ca2+-binding EF-hand superfamily protein